MAYQHSIGKLAEMAKPGQRYDYVMEFIAIAGLERIEVLTAELAKLNGHLEALAQLPKKMDDLVQETKKARSAL